MMRTSGSFAGKRVDRENECCYNDKAIYEPLAQSVEHLTFNQVVGGSNPPCFILWFYSFYLLNIIVNHSVNLFNKGKHLFKIYECLYKRIACFFIDFIVFCKMI